MLTVKEAQNKTNKYTDENTYQNKFMTDMIKIYHHFKEKNDSCYRYIFIRNKNQYTK